MGENPERAIIFPQDHVYEGKTTFTVIGKEEIYCIDLYVTVISWLIQGDFGRILPSKNSLQCKCLM